MSSTNLPKNRASQGPWCGGAQFGCIVLIALLCIIGLHISNGRLNFKQLFRASAGQEKGIFAAFPLFSAWIPF
jgi:hypothetical protein